MESTFENEELKENFNCGSDCRYLRTYVPLSRQTACYHPVPLGLRRSVSYEEKSTEKNLEKCKTQNSSNLSLPGSSLNYSLESLCLRLRPYQLLPELNEFIAKCDSEHKFDWWNSVNHLWPLIEDLILSEKLENDFKDDQNEEDEEFVLFQKSRRNGRRNAVCFAIDRLCYNEQLILFVAITAELQIQFNLKSSGFRI